MQRPRREEIEDFAREHRDQVSLGDLLAVCGYLPCRVPGIDRVNMLSARYLVEAQQREAHALVGQVLGYYWHRLELAASRPDCRRCEVPAGRKRGRWHCRSCGRWLQRRRKR